jgi:LysM repeat protein
MALSQKWKDSVEPGVTDAAWDKYDSVIQIEIAASNLRLKNIPGYKTVDWKVVKAMIWVESGANSPAWNTAPIQIGVPGDPGLGVLQRGENGSDLIMTTDLANRVKNTQLVSTDPNLNIQAGIAYLFTQMSKSEIISVVDDPSVLNYTVAAGDSLDKISKKLGTTVDNLKSQNPGAGAMIHPKDVLKYQKAMMKRQIMGWRDFNVMTTIADRYNGGGDPDYAAKLVYVLDLFKKLKRPATP